MTDQPDIIVGIDLGTTNSLVAWCDERGPQIVRCDAEGRPASGIVPSVINIEEGGRRIVVGEEARAHAEERPQSTIYSVKRLMGKGYADVQKDLRYLAYRVVPYGSEQGRDIAAVEVQGRIYTPPELSAMILRELKRRAEAHFGHEVRRAVITVPAYFDDAQRQATRDAGRIAGLEVVRIINEPTAAALAYGLDRHEQSTVAVYDLGGGTFDVSILRLERGVSEVLSTAGDTHLGGDDFDREIIRLVQREVQERFGLTIDSPTIRQQLRLFAERVKCELSEHEASPLSIDLGQGRVYERLLTREEFEGLIEPWVRRTLDACRRALRDAGLSPGDIEEVVLVGGSTRVPLVRRQVAEFFGREPYTALNPEEVVALGAAVQGAILTGRQRGLLLDVTPLSLGIETMGGAMGKLIMRNTKIPCQAREMFTTFVDGQTNITINVLQGERELARDCRSLGRFELRGIPPMPAGIPKIEVTFLIDHNGILHVSAKELRSGKQASIQIVPSHGLTPEEVDRMEQESIEHAREDMEAHRLIDLRNQVLLDTRRAEQMLERVGDELPGEQREAVRSAIARLREMAETATDANALHAALQEFDRLTVPLAERAVTAALRDAEDA